jgi:hypothetical protein
VNIANHLSIVWGVTMAIMALLEWNSLEREPLREPLLSPFIERTITLNKIVGEKTAGNGASLDAGSASGHPDHSTLQSVVEIRFNGPLFLACFFGPVLLFHGVTRMLVGLRRGKT